MSQPSRIYLLWNRKWHHYQESHDEVYVYHDRQKAERDALLMVCDVVELSPSLTYAIRYDPVPGCHGEPHCFLHFHPFYGDVTKTATLEDATTWETVEEARQRLYPYQTGPDDRYSQGKIVEVKMVRQITREVED